MTGTAAELTGKKPVAALRFIYHRATALTISIIMIVVSIGIGAHEPLEKMKTEVEAVFYTGTQDEPFNLMDDMLVRVTLARELISTAKLYLPVNYYIFSDIEYWIFYLENASTPWGKYDANARIGGICTKLRGVLGTTGMTDADRAVVEENRIKMRQQLDVIIAHGDIYNREVEKLNDSMSAFPTNIARMLGFVKLAEYFRDPNFHKYNFNINTSVVS